MRHAARGIQVSFFFHAGALALVFWLSNFMQYEKKPVVLDFSLENTRGEKSIQEPVHRQAPEKKAESPPVHRMNIPQPAVETRVPPVLKETKKEGPLQTNQQAVPVMTAQETAGNPHDKRQGPSDSGGPAGGAKNVAAPPEEGGGSGAQQQKDRYLKEHFAYIRDTVLKKLSFPAMARKLGWSGKVTVSFVICADGNVEDLRVVESSGFGLLDRNALETIKKACPFPRPPVRAELIMPVVYRLE
jgi:protein TonB